MRFDGIQGDDFMVDVSGKMDSIPSITKPLNGEGTPEYNTLDEPIRLTIVKLSLYIKLNDECEF